MPYPIISSVLVPSVLSKTLIKDYQLNSLFTTRKEILFSNPWKTTIETLRATYWY